MAKCPKCQNDIADDFGLVTCSHCGAQVLLSIDGPVDSSPSPVAAGFESALGTELLSEIQEDENQNKGSVAEIDTSAQKRVSPQEALPQDPPLPATPDMSDVADFGNSPVSLAREGALRFNIFLSGIDTIDIRNQVQEALTDERFLWDAEALVAASRNGELKITDVSAVKSSLIIQRLRSVSIDIRWEQHAIHQ